MTNELGQFSFKDTPDGDYFIHVEVRREKGAPIPYYPDGYVPLKIDSGAESSSIKLALDQGICGSLAYERQTENFSNAQTN
jgi:hypothetical protein